MIPIHVVSTHRADEGFTWPLSAAIRADNRFEFVDYSDAHVLVLLGDRTELLREAASAIGRAQIIAHMAGGERTKGSTDDTVRDAITKLAHLHYPFHEAGKRRIMDLQEQEWRICVAGNPAVDAIKTDRLMTVEELMARFPEPFKRRPMLGDVVVAVHPVTNTPGETTEICRVLTSILRWSPRTCYLSTPNQDPGSDEIEACFRDLEDSTHVLLPNLGAHAFRSLMAICCTIIGNSSALITEAPHLGCLPVLIGTRQEGRLPDESDGNACKRILDHIAANIGRPDIRIK